MYRWRRLAGVVCLITFLTACGNGNGGSDNGGGPGGTTGAVTVSSGETAVANISVTAPQSNPTPNARFLGVNFANGGATITGDTVSRAQGTATVTIYGPGLKGSMKATISGPNDLIVGALTAITAQDGTPGVQFPITLTNNTSLGARSVAQDAKGDITSFSGGLEVVP